MGLIDNISMNAKAKALALTVLRNTENAHEAALKNWKENMDFIWADEAITAAVLKEIGTDAKDVLAILQSNSDTLESAAPGVTIDKALLVKEHIVNDDGTVVLKNP